MCCAWLICIRPFATDRIEFSQGMISLEQPLGAAMLSAVAGRPVRLSNTENGWMYGCSSARGITNEIFRGAPLPQSDASRLRLQFRSIGAQRRDRIDACCAPRRNDGEQLVRISDGVDPDEERIEERATLLRNRSATI